MSTEKAITSVKQHVNGLKSAAAVISDPLLGEQLINKFSEMYELPIKEAKRFYNREKDNFGKLISQSVALQNCTPMSAYLAFGTVMKLKLSFDNGRSPLVYLIPGNRNIGTKDEPKWVSEMVAQPSPEGEKEARLSTGILKKVGQPIIVHEGDEFEEELNLETGQVEVTKFKRHDKTEKIKASFIIITEPDGSVVHKVFKPVDMERWKAASAKKNRGNANALYSSGVNGQIDEAFLKGKTLLHSFKGYKQVDFGSSIEGFVADKDEAKKINPDYTDDGFDSYEELPTEKQTPQNEAFTKELSEPEPVKASVKIETTGDDDELFS